MTVKSKTNSTASFNPGMHSSTCSASINCIRNGRRGFSGYQNDGGLTNVRFKMVFPPALNSYAMPARDGESLPLQEAMEKNREHVETWGGCG